MTKDNVLALYESGKSPKEIAEIIGITSKSVCRRLNRAGIRLPVGKPPKYTVNTSFFETWSPQMAYVLGFIITDGCIEGNSVVIAQKEREILEHIRDAMGANFPIKHRINTHGGNIYSLRVSRKEIVEDLRRLGVTERKSLTVRFPAIPDEYLPHFLRGVIDGDGWVHPKGYVINITTGSTDFAEGLRQVFEDYGLNTRITKDTAFRVWVSGKADVNRLGSLLYEESGGLFVSRKASRFNISA